MSFGRTVIKGDQQSALFLSCNQLLSSDQSILKPATSSECTTTRRKTGGGFSVAVRLVGYRAQADGIHVAPVGLELRVLQRIAVALEGQGVQKTGVAGKIRAASNRLCRPARYSHPRSHCTNG